jgi:diguanylate cyclase
MITKHAEDLDQSYAIGDQAMGNLKQDRIPAWPEMYEVLYYYLCGAEYNIIAEIDKLRANQGHLSTDDLLDIHDRFLNSETSHAVSEEVGSKISSEIRKILLSMRAAGKQSEEYDAALKEIETKFADIKSPDQLHGVVKLLSNVTSSIAQNNRELNDQLQQSVQKIDVLHHDLEKARNESNTDALTSLANRKKFDHALRQAIRQSRQDGSGLSLMLADIDHFKAFNDRFGHQTGDQVLRLVSHTLKAGIKGRDTAARYGGEEFAIILPSTHIDNAHRIAEQVREAVMSKELIKRSTGENLGRITISIGVAEIQPGESSSHLIERADKALYMAKKSGRNRCIVADAAPPQNEAVA